MKTISSFTEIIINSLCGPIATVAVSVTIALTLLLQSSLAGEPEYMKLKLKVGQAIEVKGYYSKDSIFVATDIQLLPRPRRPKIRGEIQDIDYKHNTITLMGIPIRIGKHTEFLDKGDSKTTFDDLKIGQRVYVGCKVDTAGHWKAREVTSYRVKKSNKIKGTLTGISMDGHSPDTLDISGLLILLNKKTDADDEIGWSFIEKELFGDLSAGSPMGMDYGMFMSENILVEGNYRQDVRRERQFDLSDRRNNDQDDTQPELRLEMSGYWNKNIRTFAQIRLRNRYVLSGDRGQPPDTLLVPVTQLYLLAQDIGGTGFALQIGRQDFDEPREWVFDEYLDAVRIYYYNIRPVVFEAAYIIHSVFPLKEKTQTWTDFFARVRWFHDRDNVLSTYILTRRDSDIIRKRQPKWWGLRYYGLVENARATVRPWVDWAIMRGEDKHKTVKAWAFDVGATAIATSVTGVPSLTVAYAIGSGDDNKFDSIDHRFRQTGYDDNVDRFGGMVSVRYYGAVLFPELSNLKILTLGAGIRPVEDASIELVYHSYRQHLPNKKMKGTLVSPSPDGISDDIGWGLDFVLGVSRLWDRVGGSWTLGVFNPGEAFAPLFEKNAFLSKLNITVGL